MASGRRRDRISQGEVKPSSWGLRIEVVDGARERVRLRSTGIPAKEVRTILGTIAFLFVRDPDDNDRLFFQVPTRDPKVTGRRA